MKPSSQSRIFVSYGRRGNGLKWKAALLRALHVFERHHLLDVWQDGRIRESAIWDDDIKSAMNGAQLAVVLLTKEALESKYILNVEFPCLKQRQQQDKLPVFPIICESCNWRDYDWLRTTQAANGAAPLAELSDSAQDQVFRKLATAMAERLSYLVLNEDSARSTSEYAIGEVRTYLDKFPLTRSSGLREEKLIGREQELALLDLAFAQPHTAIVSLVAWGGVGKTMLVQHWLQRLQREGWFGARRVYAWSFYSQGTKEDRQASEDIFLAHALEWFGVQCEPTLSPWDKGRLLADTVACGRTLLILDGIEPLQYPPGPMGGQLRAPGVQSLLKQLARKANLAKSENQNSNSETNCLCLVTTREPLTDLADFQRREGSQWGSVLRVDLGNLTVEAGAALLHHAGANRAGAAEIKPNDKELLAASREVDGHALTLNLLGRFLARAHGGDIRRRDLVKFEEADRKEQGGTTFRMLAAFENWFAKGGEFGARQLTILRILGLFDRPADDGCIAALRKPPVIAGLTEPLFATKLDAATHQAISEPLVDEDWNTATSFLADFSLLVIHADSDNQERFLDCHPLIREHFAGALRLSSPRTWQSAHRRLYDHFQDYSEYQPSTILGLQLLYDAIGHGCCAESKEEAFKLYHERIMRGAENYSWTKLGTIGMDLQAVANFFEKPWIQLFPGLTLSSRAWLLNQAGFYLCATGRLGEAVEVMRLAADMWAKLQNWVDASTSSGNLSEIERVMGNLLAAQRAAERSINFALLSGNWRLHRRNLALLADVLFQRGQRRESSALFREAEDSQATNQPDHPMLYSLPGFLYSELLLNVVERLAWAACLGQIVRAEEDRSIDTRETWEPLLRICREVDQRFGRILDWYETGGWAGLHDFGTGHLSRARAMLYFSELSTSQVDATRTRRVAFQQVIASVDRLRSASMQHRIPGALLTRAWLRYIEGDGNGARDDLDEAWDISERGPMRLHMADIHLYRARLFFRENPYPWNKNPDGTARGPQDDVAAAQNLIRDCGYQRRDGELDDATKAILGAWPS